MKAEPKFFCEYCGTEVTAKARNCRKCGKFFSSVRCPSCGFSGDVPMFRDGCPACGYAFPENERNSSRSVINKPRPETDPLPWWMYLLSLLLLAAVLFFILSRQ